MPYLITVDLPNLAEGAELAVDGLGVFTVGDNIVPDDVVDQWRTVNSHQEPVFADDDENREHQLSTMTVPGDVYEYVKRLDGVSIKYIDSEDDLDSQSADDLDSAGASDLGSALASVQATGAQDGAPTLNPPALSTPGDSSNSNDGEGDK